MLKLYDIRKDYKVADSYVHALKGVTLNFRENEFVCVLGPSGCGKTTLLNIIGGLDRYTSGDLEIDGKSTKQFSGHDWDVYRNHRIGFIFQSYNLIPHQTVLGNVELALTIAGVSREERKERATQALERVGLGAELNKRPNQLSGGQMQRVAIARALVNNPAILLADEPTGALDSETSVQIMELIKEIAGERLVIMVTHNPELAEQYASRIVRLKDGLVEADSDPFDGEEAPSALPFERDVAADTDAAVEGEVPTPPASKKKGKKERARMGWLTTFLLSARNLLTKKGRTAITAVAGSIGIISVCLVLALSSGFNHYVKRTEEDMLSYYPLEITESSLDMGAAMTAFMSGSNAPDMSRLEDKVYVDSFLTELGQGMTVTNNVSQNYIDYINRMDPAWYSAIQYKYGAAIAGNLFTDVKTGGIEIQGTYHDEEDRFFSLDELKTYYIAELMAYKPEYANLVQFAGFFGNVVNKMPGTSDFTDENYAAYVRSQYDVVGEFPKNENEAVIVVEPNGSMTDLTMAQLGLLNEKDFLALFDKGQDEDETPTYKPYEEIIGRQYVLYFNDAVYSANPASNGKPVVDPKEENPVYPYLYGGDKTDAPREPAQDTASTKLTPVIVDEEEGIDLRVTGILRLKEGLNYGCLTSGLNITEAAVTHYVEKNVDSAIVKDILGTVQTAYETEFCVGVFAQNLASYYSEQLGMLVSQGKTVPRLLGGVNSYNGFSIYAKDFTGKEHILEHLDAWNDACEAEGVIGGVQLKPTDKVSYSDTVGMLMSMVQSILNIITYVLVAFTAISLVVSSVMIGIITYVSVVERVKEIGVLRSLGARKRDIKNLFNAETFIIGLGAGLFGVVMTYLLSLVINVILKSLTGIAGLAALSPIAALIMVCVSVALTLISGLIPASAAAKKDPVIALRTE